MLSRNLKNEAAQTRFALQQKITMVPFYIIYQLGSVFVTYPVQYKVMNGGLLRHEGFKYTFTNLTFRHRASSI